jgi:hypothetical protein
MDNQVPKALEAARKRVLGIGHDVAIPIATRVKTRNAKKLN